MDIPLLLKSILMGIIEGVTEFLPISSTGHLILAADYLHFLQGEEREAYEIIVQLGAVLAVIWEYRRKIAANLVALPQSASARRFALGLGFAFVPIAIVGLLLEDAIRRFLFTPVAVGVALIAGGFIMMWADHRQHRVQVDDAEKTPMKTAAQIGLIQCAALIPGTSRSGATLVAGLLLGLSRRAATEYSFFLGIPTLGIAGLYAVVHARAAIGIDHIAVFGAGFLAAFLSALLVIHLLVRFVSTHSFAAFAWYRVAFGLLVLWLWSNGLP